jgi:hypothetical protein
MDGAGQALREQQMLITGCAQHLESTTREMRIAKKQNPNRKLKSEALTAVKIHTGVFSVYVVWRNISAPIIPKHTQYVPPESNSLPTRLRGARRSKYKPRVFHAMEIN